MERALPTRTRPERPAACCRAPGEADGLTEPRRRRLLAALKALADPTRLEILRIVAAQTDPICACDIVAQFHLRQPTISHHLKVLADARLLVATRCGVWMHYALDSRGAEALDDLVLLLAPRRVKGALREA